MDTDATRATGATGATGTTGATGATGVGTRGHEPGKTSPSPERDTKRLSGPALRFDVAAEVEALLGEPAWERFDRNARTLVKDGGLRVVLTALKSGASLAEHRVSARVIVQTVSGHLRLHLMEGDTITVDLPAGQLAVLQPGITHRVEAVEESAFLLTVANLEEDEEVEADSRWPRAQSSTALFPCSAARSLGSPFAVRGILPGADTGRRQTAPLQAGGGVR